MLLRADLSVAKKKYKKLYSSTYICYPIAARLRTPKQNPHQSQLAYTLKNMGTVEVNGYDTVHIFTFRKLSKAFFAGPDLARGPGQVVLRDFAGRVTSRQEVFELSWVGSGPGRRFSISRVGSGRVGSGRLDPTRPNLT